jgi:hypothetical protein
VKDFEGQQLAMETAERRSQGAEPRGEAGQASGIGTDPRADAYRRDLASAPKTKDIVILYLKAGVSPKYIACRFGVDLERCERYVAALKKQEELKREREIAKSGDSPTPEGREVDHGT